MGEARCEFGIKAGIEGPGLTSVFEHWSRETEVGIAF